MPIPHSGPRGSPVTDLARQRVRSSAIAAATVVPGRDCHGSAVHLQNEDACRLRHGLTPRKACRQIRLDRNLRLVALQMVCQECARFPSEVVMPNPSCPVARNSDSSSGQGPISGSLSGVAARNPVQTRIAERAPISGRYHCARSIIAARISCVHCRILRAELPRGANENLPRFARLHVERD